MPLDLSSHSKIDRICIIKLTKIIKSVDAGCAKTSQLELHKLYFDYPIILLFRGILILQFFRHGDFQQKKLAASAVKDVKWQRLLAFLASSLWRREDSSGWLAWGASRVKRLDMRDDTRVDNGDITKYTPEKIFMPKRSLKCFTHHWTWLR